MKNTEEDVIHKVIMPFLASKGFKPEDLYFQKSFTLQLGRGVYRVDTEEQRTTGQARLDILVTENEKNVFLIEAKSDSAKLTDEDRDQAISYARLVHPMAPITIVTNGKEVRLYDTVTKVPIGDNQNIGDYELTTDDLTRIRDEALEAFIGYSYDNVRIFCNAQAEAGMSTLLGSQENQSKIFIPEVYVSSAQLLGHFQKFLKSEEPAFAIVGESGSGKTCHMCALAIEHAKQNAVLFYRAAHLVDGIARTLANDFNWAFSTQTDDVSLFKKLQTVCRGEKLAIFIDGIDIWNSPTKVEMLADFASKIRGKGIKLIVSCKASVWKDFLKTQSVPTRLSGQLFSPTEGANEHALGRFSEEEFHELLEKYRRFYGFSGLFEKDVLDECKRSPFLLRIFFEVAQHTNCRNLTFSVKQFHEKYYEATIEKLPSEDKQKAEYQLKRIAQTLLEKDVDSIDIDTIHEKLNDTVIESLFDNNVLERTRVNAHTYVAFYFQKFRDYCMAYRVKKWDMMSPDEFEKDLPSCETNNVHYEALKLFYQFADAEKKRVIDGPLRRSAEEYLKHYIEILDEHFPKLKSMFSPQGVSFHLSLATKQSSSDNNAIGFLGILDIRRRMITAYGFRPINETDEGVLLIPVDGYWVSRSNLCFLFGGDMLHFVNSSDGFRNINTRKQVLEHEIVSQLEKLVDQCILYEGDNYFLPLELALGIVIGTLGDIHRPKRAMTVSSYLPISIESADYAIRYQEAYRHFQDLLLEEKIKAGIVKRKWKGSIASVSYSFMKGELEEVSQKAHEAAMHKTDLQLKGINVDLKKRDFFLKRALSAISKKRDIIDETILPDKDASTMGEHGPLDTYKRETYFEAISRLFALFLKEYKILIETNFPTLRQRFWLYSLMPLHMIVEVRTYQNGIELTKYVCKDDAITSNSVTVCRKGEIKFDQESSSLTFRGKQHKVHSIGVSGDVAYGMYTPLLGIPRELTILRRMVYDEVKSELREVVKEIRNL